MFLNPSANDAFENSTIAEPHYKPIRQLLACARAGVNPSFYTELYRKIVVHRKILEQFRSARDPLSNRETHVEGTQRKDERKKRNRSLQPRSCQRIGLRKLK